MKWFPFIPMKLDSFSSVADKLRSIGYIHQISLYD